MGPYSLKHLILHASFFVFVLAMGLRSEPSYAVQVPGLYQASVPVASQQSKDRGDAFASALDIVLRKVSGDRTIHSSSGLDSVLSRPEQFVSSFSYRDNPDYLELQTLHRELALQSQTDSDAALVGGEESLEGEPSSLGAKGPMPYLLDVVFSSSAVNSKMTNFGVPIWGSTRPSLLFWVVMQDVGGRRLLGTADDSYVGAALNAAARQGLPVFFPVVDLEDMSSVDVNEVWGLYPEAVEVGANRYAPDLNILVKYKASALVSNASIELDWAFNLKGILYTGTVVGDNSLNAWAELIDELSMILSSRYAVRQSSDLQQGLMNIEVSGVESFADYAELETYLLALPTVKNRSLLWVKGSRVSYALDLKGQRAQFFEYVDLGNKMRREELVLMPEPVSSGITVESGLGVDAVSQAPVATNTEYFVWTHATSLKD